MQTITLNDGVAIPQIGFGTFQIPAGEETERAVAFALSCGCRHIDTAAAYFNEADVGKAVRASGVRREDVFVTSKLWLQDYGYEAARKGIDASLAKLGLGYIDLYLVHQLPGTAGEVLRRPEVRPVSLLQRGRRVRVLQRRRTRRLLAHGAEYACQDLWRPRQSRGWPQGKIISVGSKTLSAWLCWKIAR